MKKKTLINLKKSKKYQLIAFLSLLLTPIISFAQTPNQKSDIISKTNIHKLKKLQNKYAKKNSEEKSYATKMAKENGWEVTQELPNGKYKELQRVTKNGIPIYYETSNIGASASTRTNHLNSMGSLGLSLDGQNMTASVWDGGHARLTHQEFKNTNEDSRISIKDAESLIPTYGDYHGSHVTGTIAASGTEPDAKGMAPKAQINSYDWDNDFAEVAAAAANGMLISNHSYGLNSSRLDEIYFGGYLDESPIWDEISYNAPYFLMVVAAGNDGLNDFSNESPLEGNSNYDKLTGKAVSKNNLCVANSEQATIDGHGNLLSVDINDFSSQGPTDDYRIKPDIAGNGSFIYSSSYLTDDHYELLSGTSMSSPNVAGSLLLLQEHYENLNNNFMRAATLKGIALHTADDAGPIGPDALFGWGLLNAKTAAKTISESGNGSRIEELELFSGESYSITVESDGVNPLLASISWTDPAGETQTLANDSTPILVNDLDITVTSETSTYSPYRLTSITTNDTGDNTVDPFERVDVNNASGTYTITVTNKGTLTGGSQNYSLIITGLLASAEICNAVTPQDVIAHSISDTSATISWSQTSANNHELRYREVGSTNWSSQEVSGYAYTISGLSPTTPYEVQVRSNCTDGDTSNYSNTTTFTSSKITYCKSIGDPERTLIGNVTLKDINNTSKNLNGYADFSHISTNLTAGETNTIIITKDRYIFYDFYFAIYIDYNQNGSFSDQDELVWTSGSSLDIQTVRGSFTVPNTAVNGPTRMRVSMAFGVTPDPCFIFFDGDVEDYTVVINGGGDTPDITNCELNTVTFPYHEGFENTIGVWTQSTDDDIDWSIHRNNTPSINTGPSAASENDYYLYVEASLTQTGKISSQAILTSPCIDISNLPQANLSFDYHMYGAADMGDFDVEISTDEGLNWTSIWSQNGNQGNSWLTANIDLSPYVDNGIKLRLNRTIGSTWQADIAIDNLSINSASSKTIAVTSEVLNNDLFSVYPVPTSGPIISILPAKTEVQTYSIYNMNGQQIKQGTFIDSINIEELKAGFYLISIGVGSEITSPKEFIKL